MTKHVKGDKAEGGNFQRRRERVKEVVWNLDNAMRRHFLWVLHTQGFSRPYLRGVKERTCSGGAPGFPKGLELKAAYYVETVGVEEAFF